MPSSAPTGFHHLSEEGKASKTAFLQGHHNYDWHTAVEKVQDEHKQKDLLTASFTSTVYYNDRKLEIVWINERKLLLGKINILFWHSYISESCQFSKYVILFNLMPELIFVTS